MGQSTAPMTQVLQAMGAGEEQAAEKLLPLVYEELRKLAAHKMANEAPGQTLQPTALVHEAWLRLTGASHPGLERPGALLPGRRRSHAPHPGGSRAATNRGEARTRPPAYGVVGFQTPGCLGG